jgi:hypothetical protein
MDEEEAGRESLLEAASAQASLGMVETMMGDEVEPEDDRAEEGGGKGWGELELDIERNRHRPWSASTFLMRLISRFTRRGWFTFHKDNAPKSSSPFLS